MSIGEAIERIRRMFKTGKGCTNICLFCEYYSMCKEDDVNEVKEKNEYEACIKK